MSGSFNKMSRRRLSSEFSDWIKPAGGIKCSMVKKPNKGSRFSFSKCSFGVRYEDGTRPGLGWCLRVSPYAPL